MKTTVLASNITALRNHRGLNQGDFADLVEGASQSYISKWEKKGVEPNGIALASLAQLAGVNVKDFVTKEWEPPHGALQTPEQLPTISADGEETVGITALDLSLSMGPGTLIEEFVESEPVQFDISLLRSITRSPFDRLRLVRGIGTSMEPTFRAEDRFLIDTTVREMTRLDGYYWITIDGAHGLKRLRPAGEDRVLVISENPDFENDRLDKRAVRIEGRAIWFARGL